ncbi:MAG: ATP-binding protein [Termitinemataceae bacterium]|nr:MAG: ATP-binding protein [Termitinemataceae bacterium]
MQYYGRNLFSFIENTAETRPLIYINGPRQTGKSTMARNLKFQKNPNYMTFDTPSIFRSAHNDPENFIKSLPRDIVNIIDEVQMCPEIFPYLKTAVDESRVPGNQTGTKTKCLYLLTGSANLMALPTLSQALVGRMSVITLLPFSTAEYHKKNVNFIDKLFKEKLEYKKFKRCDIVNTIKTATFPEPALHKNINQTQWFDDYLNTLIQRDIQVVSEIRRPQKIITLLSLLAIRAGSLLNNVSISQEGGFDMKTYERYKGSCINTYIIFELKPWAKPMRINKRFTKSPKLYFTDTNMLAYLLRRDLGTIYKTDPITMGHLFENFIACEIMKAASCSCEYEVSFFRTSDNKEVDFVIENSNGDVIGIEVKLSGSISPKDLAGLNLLKLGLGDKFKRGIILYSGEDLISFAKDIWAVPLPFLWE